MNTEQFTLSTAHEIYMYSAQKAYEYLRLRISKTRSEEVSTTIAEDIHNTLDAPKNRREVLLETLYKAHNWITDTYKNDDYEGLEDKDDVSFIALDSDNDEYYTLQNKLLKLPIHKREVLDLQYYFNLTPQEIGFITSKSEGEVRVSLLRTMRELRS